MNKREFIALLVGAAAWSVVERGKKDACDRISERRTPSVTAHTTTDLSTPRPRFEAAWILGLTVISTS
jgi:hypothetical protein